MTNLLFVFGTRPEAIKMCPLVHELRSGDYDAKVSVCVTGQHREMLQQVLEVFAIEPQYDLDLMQPGQSLSQVASRVLDKLDSVFDQAKPDMVLVQGDTATTFCGALAAFYRRIPVGHVEAGLRTWNLQQPFPEEANRVLTTRLATLHFAATEGNRRNLLEEGVSPDLISVTGNTVIDAVLYVRDGLETGRLQGWDGAATLDPSRKLVLVTAHRRESFGEGFENICQALSQLALREDVEILYPVHPNPNVRGPVERHLAGRSRIHLIDPVSYVPFVDLMRRAHLILSDSGGVQEEAPSFGKPVLVLREATERPEAVEAGTVRLVGTDPSRILFHAHRLLDDSEEYASMARVHNPYGDGEACRRIAGIIHSFFEAKRVPNELRVGI